MERMVSSSPPHLLHRSPSKSESQSYESKEEAQPVEDDISDEWSGQSEQEVRPSLSESSEFSVNSAIKRFSFSRWRNKTEQLEDQLIEEMQGRKANKNLIEVELLKDRADKDKLHFFGVAFVFTGQKPSQEKICHTLMQDLLEFQKFQLVEFKTQYLRGPNDPEKAEHMLFSKGGTSFLCSKFTGLPAKVAQELANYHYVFVVGFRNTRILEVVETIDQELTEFKNEDNSLPHFCLLNAHKGISNQSFEFFIERYTSCELLFKPVINLPLRQLSLFSKLKKTLLIHGGAPLKYNLLADVILKNAPSLQLVPYCQLYPFTDILCTYLPGVTALTRFIHSGQDSLSESQIYNKWSILLGIILKYIGAIGEEALYEMECLPDALYSTQGFTVKKNSAKLLHEILHTLELVKLEPYEFQIPFPHLNRDRMRKHFIKIYNTVFQDPINPRGLHEKLTKLNLEDWWNYPEKLPLLIPYQLFQIRYKECSQLRLPLNEDQQYSFEQLIEMAQEEFLRFKERAHSNKREKPGGKWKTMTLEERLNHYEHIHSYETTPTELHVRKASEKEEEDSLSYYETGEEMTEILKKRGGKRKKVEYLGEGFRKVERKLEDFEQDEMIYKQRDLAAGVMLNLLDLADQV